MVNNMYSVVSACVISVNWEPPHKNPKKFENSKKISMKTFN